jgi:hypothetical protein
MEIQRLLNNPGVISHKEIVQTIVEYLKLNVEAQSSIELIEAYLPAPAPQVQQQKAEESSLQDAGLKKLD